MINLEHVVLASPEQMEFVIEGMRNPMNSWEKSDSEKEFTNAKWPEEMFILGENDHYLMQRLSKAGTDHRKFMRMMPVYVRITAPLYWWKEFDTYKVGTATNSCSTVHRIVEKDFTLEDFSYEHLGVTVPAEKNDGDECYQNLWLERMRSTVEALNIARGFYNRENDSKLKEDYWWQMIQLLPSSYNQTRNVMFNYEVLANIYRQRKNHKLDEWRDFCKWIESLPYSEFVTCGVKESIPETTSDIRQAFGILKSAGIKLTKEQLEELRKNGIFCYPVSDPKEKQGEEITDQADSFL